MAAFRFRVCPFRVDKRPSGGVNMKLLNRGAVHGYDHNDRKACNTMEQR